MNLTEEKQQLEARLAEINKQLEQQPKEGEWWYWEHAPIENKGVVRCNGKISPRGHYGYTEGYSLRRGYLTDNDAYLHKEKDVFRPATTSEIEYFMGLHAERLYKDGCVIDRKNLSKQAATISTDEEKLNFKYPCRFNPTIGCFEYGGVWVRDENGTWATVVKEEVKIESKPTEFEWQPVLKPKKLVKKSVNLQRKIDKLEGQLHAEKVENKRLLDLINEFVNTIKKTV